MSSQILYRRLWMEGRRHRPLLLPLVPGTDEGGPDEPSSSWRGTEASGASKPKPQPSRAHSPWSLQPLRGGTRKYLSHQMYEQKGGRGRLPFPDVWRLPEVGCLGSPLGKSLPPSPPSSFTYFTSPNSQTQEGAWLLSLPHTHLASHPRTDRKDRILSSRPAFLPQLLLSEVSAG